MGKIASTHAMLTGLRSVTVVVAVVAAAACSRFHGAARFVSDPPGAEVVSLDDGALLGVTPFTVWWEEESRVQRRLNVLYRKEGYEPKPAATYVTLKHSSKNRAYNDLHTVNVTLVPVK